MLVRSRYNCANETFLQMSHACEAPEVQRFPVLRRKLEEVMGKFLRDGIKPAERMIGNMIEMEVILCSFLEISLLISKS